MTVQVLEVPATDAERLNTMYPDGPQVPDQSHLIDAAGKAAIEAEQNKGNLIQKLRTIAKAIAVAEDALAKGPYADLVIMICQLLSLPQVMRPKLAKIGEWILDAQGRFDQAEKVVKLPDETLTVRKPEAGKSNSNKQYANFFTTMARWELRQYNKSETKHADRMRAAGTPITATIAYNGHTYDSPVAALRAEVPWSTVYRRFRNALNPVFLDLSDKPESDDNDAVRKAALNNVKAYKVKVRTVNDMGDTVQGTVALLGSRAATLGTVIGLLQGLKLPLTKRQYSEVEAALMLLAPKAKNTDPPATQP